MVSIKELRLSARQSLANIRYDSPLADIDCILSALGFSKSDILLGEKTLSDKDEQAFWAAFERLKAGEPVQYIVGRCEFMSLEFEVTPATLIPRADTEILVEKVIELCRGIETPRIFEIGTGSGCIAVSLAYYIKGASVTSADISGAALEVAQKNAKRNDVNVRFVERDILSGFPRLEEPPHIVVSNPPYIPCRDIPTLDKKVRAFEPLTALDGGDDGLDFYRFIIENSPLEKGGYLAFEVGIGQSRLVADLMSPTFENIEIVKDLAGIERVVTGKLK